VHVKITEEQLFQSLLSHSLPKHLAKFPASIEATIVNGAEERMNDVVEQMPGWPPKSFDIFVQKSKAAWL